jgi:hypothetical protein
LTVLCFESPNDTIHATVELNRLCGGSLVILLLID